MAAPWKPWQVVLAVVGAIIVALLAAWGIWYLVWVETRDEVSEGSIKGLHVSSHVDLDRYLGLWYEHRRINSWFEPADYTNVTAFYEKDDAQTGHIIVTNSATDGSGVRRVSKGTAAVTNIKGVLDVSFFAPFSGYYVIIGLKSDENTYTHAIVASPSRDFLWLLARSPEPIDTDTEMWFNGIALKNGYKTDEGGVAGIVKVI